MGKFETTAGGNIRVGMWWDPDVLKGLNMAAWEPNLQLGGVSRTDGFGNRWAYVEFHRGNLSENNIRDGSPLVFDDDSTYVVTPDVSRGGTNPRLAGVLRINSAISDVPETGWRGVIQVGGVAEDVRVASGYNPADNATVGMTSDGVVSAVAAGGTTEVLGKVISGGQGNGVAVDVQLTLGKTRGMGKAKELRAALEEARG